MLCVQIMTCCAELPSFLPPVFPSSSFVKLPSFLPCERNLCKAIKGNDGHPFCMSLWSMVRTSLCPMSCRMERFWWVWNTKSLTRRSKSFMKCTRDLCAKVRCIFPLQFDMLGFSFKCFLTSDWCFLADPRWEMSIPPCSDMGMPWVCQALPWRHWTVQAQAGEVTDAWTWVRSWN